LEFAGKFVIATGLLSGKKAPNNCVRMFRFIFICMALMLAMTACKNTYKQAVVETQPMREPLTARSRVYIAMPEDALDKKEPVPASGKRTALAFQEAFQRHTRNVITAKTPETREAALARARELMCDYLVFPVILEWKDRPTEWTGVRDRLALKVDLIAAESGETIRSSPISAISRWMTDGGDAPQDLLAEPVDKFVRGLFRVMVTPSALPK
jgi:hypothetical protein